MPVRYSSRSIALRGDRIITNIIDKDYSGSVTDFNIAKSGINFKTNGDARDIWKPMNLSSVALNMYLDTPDLFDFYDEISEAEEGQYFLEIRRVSSVDDSDRREFVGMILTDGLQRDDHTYPLLKLEAIDGLAILKEKTFEWSGTQFFKQIQEIFHDALTKNPVIEEIYASGDTIAYFNSSLVVNKAEFTQEFFSNIYHSDFFFDMNENYRTNWSCYRVIEELCKKYMLRVVYDDGAYYILGVDTFYNASGSDVYKSLTKAGSYGANVSSDAGLFDFSNIALDGGVYNAIKGYKTARIEASKEGSNKTFGEGVIIREGEGNGPTWDNYDGSYKLFSTLLKNTEFEVQININAFFDWGAFPPFDRTRIYHNVKVFVKYTDLVTNDVSYGYIFGNVVVDGDDEHLLRDSDTEQPASFFIKRYLNYYRSIRLKIPSYGADRKLEMKFTFAVTENFLEYVNPFLTFAQQLDFKIGASPLGSTTTVIPISSTIADTNNTGTYNVNVFSSDMYGAIGTKALVINGASADLAGFNWRIGSSGSYDGLERVITQFMIKQLVNSAKLLKLPVETDPLFFSLGLLKAFGTFQYKGKEYIITQAEQNFLEDVITFSGIEKKAPSTATVTINSLIPNRPPVGGSGESAAYSNAQIVRNNTSWIIRDINITTGVTEIDTPIEMYLPIDATQESVVNSLLVLVDGVTWTIVQAFNPADRRPRSVVDRSNEKIQFNRTLTNTVVKLVYQNNIIKDPEYEVA